VAEGLSRYVTVVTRQLALAVLGSNFGHAPRFSVFVRRSPHVA
jgi:hypothetical protein